MTVRFSAQPVATCSTNNSVDVQLSTQKMSLHLDMTLLLEGPRNLDFAKAESFHACYLAHFTAIRELLQDLPETNPGVPSCSPHHSALNQCPALSLVIA